MHARLVALVLASVLASCSPAARTAMEPASVSAQSKGVSLSRFDDRVEVSLDGRPLTTFHFHSKWDKPFLHPIRTLSGKVLSRGYPVEPLPGEQQDHVWHRGFWYGHGDVNGEDFWREKPDRSTSRLVLTAEPKLSPGALEATLAMTTPKGKRMGTVTERYAFAQDGKSILIDTTITVAADGGEALRFGDSDDGGFAFRLSDAFREDRGAELTNSEGQTGTEAMWGKPARWVKYSATLDGTRVGVAVLDHPSNLRHPTRWHARGYSLCAANPFALGSFTKDKAVDGSYTLPAAQKLVLRYLVIVHEGEIGRDALERHFSRFGGRS